MSARVRLGIAMAAAAALVGAGSIAPCLADTPSCPGTQSFVALGGGCTGFSTPVAVLDTTCVGAPTTARAWFDLPAGEIGFVRGATSGDTLQVQACDAFEVTGLPAGTKVTCNPILDVDGWIEPVGCSGAGCTGTLRATLFDSFFSSTGYVTATDVSGRVTMHRSLQLMLTQLTVGQKHVIYYWLEFMVAPGGNHQGMATGHLHLSGLPEGVTVTSCQGYPSMSVGVKTTTWGKIKTMYR